MAEVEKQRFYVNGKTEFDSDEDALEQIVELKDIDFGDAFTEKETELETDEEEGIVVAFFDSEEDNSLHFYIQEEGNIVNTALRLGDGYVDMANDILDKILDYLENINVNATNVSTYFDVEFEDLNLPKDIDSDLNIKGLRVDKQDCEYIIQESREGPEAHLNRNNKQELTLDKNTLADFPKGEIESAEEFIGRFE